MPADTPSRASSRQLDGNEFGSYDSRRDTFSNQEAIVSNYNPSNADGFDYVHKPAVLNMSNPAYSIPGADLLLATEYVIGGETYDKGEVLDRNSFPELEAERNARIAAIVRDLHTKKAVQQPLIPRTIPPGRSTFSMTSGYTGSYFYQKYDVPNERVKRHGFPQKVGG